MIDPEETNELDQELPESEMTEEAEAVFAKELYIGVKEALAEPELEQLVSDFGPLEVLGRPAALAEPGPADQVTAELERQYPGRGAEIYEKAAAGDRTAKLAFGLARARVRQNCGGGIKGETR